MDVEARIRELGRAILARLPADRPSLFNPASWQGRLMDWAMRDEAFKVELFRFVDVLPVLHTPAQVSRHLHEYFARPGQEWPAWMQLGLRAVSGEGLVARAAAGQIEHSVEAMARGFIGGTDLADALPVIARLRREGVAVSVDLLGEESVSEAEAEAFAERTLRVLHGLADAAEGWPAVPRLDQDDHGPIPRANLSVKLSALYSQLEPVAFDASVAAVTARLRPILLAAAERGVSITVDMEHQQLKDLTLAAFRAALETPELDGFEHVGIAMQAYLRETERDLHELADWARRRDRRLGVRLVKGAYWDYEVLRARQLGWPVPVFTRKSETDAAFERCVRFLLEQRDTVGLAVGSHNVRSIAAALAHAEALGRPSSAVELQMLYGMAEPLKTVLVEKGCRLRDYLPVGELVPGMAYLVRRLLENTSNEGFLRAKFVEQADPEVLLAAPDATPAPAEPLPDGFANEPLSDFTRPERREGLAAALRAVRARLGEDHPLLIGGHEVTTGRWLDSLNPARLSEPVGRVACAGVPEAEAAVAAARAAWLTWREVPVAERAARLRRLAEVLRDHRDELSAWAILECGKAWREADADVAEAIDYCRYYADEAERLMIAPLRLGRYPGELNHLVYESIGPGVVITPWNFPLAIPLGMTLGAVAAGNPVILKPAETASVIAARLVAMTREAGFPTGVINYLPGYGEEVGAYLVRHPGLRFVAFTGSREVGLTILREAHTTSLEQEGVKRVVCEMGGKNAIIVDDDADLDVAVRAVVASAFGYQGQKCSACSRVIVLPGNADEFLGRLVEAARSLPFGPPEDPGALHGPVIDEPALRRIREYVELGRREAQPLLIRETGEGEGCYPPLAIFDGVDPQSRLAQEEIFGPVLAVLRADDFDHALALANATKFALTGGLISRSPSHLEHAREAFRVGDLYLNRGITGALVGRQPFGGLAFSGIGSKAGGPHYLLQFLEERVISENTIRRGFAPE